MTKYQWLGLVGVCLLVSSQAIAQGTGFTDPKAKKQQTITDEIPRLPWGVGLDLLWLVDKNNVPATSLFIRHNVSPENRLPGAWRLRAGLRLDKVNMEEADSLQSRNGQGITVLLQPGYEWQQWMGRHQVYYGADVRVQYSHSYREGSTVALDGIIIPVNHQDNMVWEIGPVGFLGYQYFLSPHVAFSTEAAYQAFYRRSRSDVFIYRNETTQEENVGNSYNERGGSFLPFYTVNINFYF